MGVGLLWQSVATAIVFGQGRLERRIGPRGLGDVVRTLPVPLVGRPAPSSPGPALAWGRSGRPGRDASSARVGAHAPHTRGPDGRSPPRRGPPRPGPTRRPRDPRERFRRLTSRAKVQRPEGPSQREDRRALGILPDASRVDRGRDAGNSCFIRSPSRECGCIHRKNRILAGGEERRVAGAGSSWRIPMDGYATPTAQAVRRVMGACTRREARHRAVNADTERDPIPCHHRWRAGACQGGRSRPADHSFFGRPRGAKPPADWDGAKTVQDGRGRVVRGRGGNPAVDRIGRGLGLPGPSTA